MKEEIRVGSLVRIKNTKQTALVVDKVSYDVAKKETYFTFENLDEPIILWRLALVESGRETVDAYLQSHHLEVISR